MCICVLNEENYCTECGKCDLCDLDPSKVCDNCCRCIEEDMADYRAIEIIDLPEIDDTMRRNLERTLELFEEGEE